MKILIIRFSSIGDIVLTSPVVRTCYHQLEEVEIHFLTKPDFAQILRNNPYIHKVWTLDSPLSSLAASLTKQDFNSIIDLHHNLRTLRLALLMRRRFHKFRKFNIRKWLLVNKMGIRMPKVHIVDRYMKAVGNLEVQNDKMGLDYFIPANCKVKLPFGEKDFTVFAIGGRHNTKKLPLRSMIDLCRKIHMPIVLIGGQEDFVSGAAISEVCKNTFNLCGKLSIDESALIIKKSLLVLTHDTGMMHIASALQKKILSVWGNTVPEFGMYPYRPHPESHLFEVPLLGCRPCSKIGYSSCPNGHFKCMLNQDLDRIAGMVNGNAGGE